MTRHCDVTTYRAGDGRLVRADLDYSADRWLDQLLRRAVPAGYLRFTRDGYDDPGAWSVDWPFVNAALDAARKAFDRVNVREVQR